MNGKATLALGITAIAAQSALAAPFLDDFSSDTSASYTGTTTYGGGGSAFDVSGGLLNLDTAGGATWDVFHNTANLAAGEFVSVDVAGGQTNDLYLSVSTILRGPNTGSADGIRFNLRNTGTLRTRQYTDGSSTDANYTDALGATDFTLYILRNTDSNFSVGYDSGSGVVLIDTFDVAGVGAQNLFVGVEDFGNGGAQTTTFDNLTIDSISSIPEPGSLALLGLGGLALLRRRR